MGTEWSVLDIQKFLMVLLDKMKKSLIKFYKSSMVALIFAHFFSMQEFGTVNLNSNLLFKNIRNFGLNDTVHCHFHKIFTNVTNIFKNWRDGF